MTMRTQAAVLFDQPGDWHIVDVDVDDPREGELLIRMVAAGICHSDDHFCTGDIPVSLPFAGGHEGAGVVEAVGPGTSEWLVGDHVVLPFLSVCGRCKWCNSGMQNLCDLGSSIMTGERPDGSSRLSLEGKNLRQMSGISTFSKLSTVDSRSAVRIDPEFDLVEACLVSCGVATGWGAAVNSAAVRPGDLVIVMGVGGVGMNAVQGAAAAGASCLIAVDPIGWKRDRAREFGATEAFATIEEAAEFARARSNGQGADSVIATVGVTTPDIVGSAFGSIRKGGVCVCVGTGNIEANDHLKVPLLELVFYQKRLQGSLYGACSPRRDIPALLELSRDGRLRLAELVTTRYAQSEINQGFADLRAGANLRGVIVYD